MGLAPYGKDTFVDEIRQDRRAQERQLPAQHELLQAARQQPGHAGAAGWNRTPGTAFQRQDGNSSLARRANRTAKSRSATWTSRTPCSIASRKCSFTCCNDLHRRVPDENLAMAGGCALNSVANGKVFSRTPFRRTWIQPAAGDEGLAIGAALYAYHAILQQPRREQMNHAYLGPEFSDDRDRSPR